MHSIPLIALDGGRDMLVKECDVGSNKSNWTKVKVLGAVQGSWRNT